MRQIKFRLVFVNIKTAEYEFRYCTLDELVYGNGFPKELHFVGKDQFIDLLDKTGTEIYENDICKSNKIIDLVKWGHGRWRYHYEDCLMCYNFAHKCALKIIGNIWLNPELLVTK